MVKKNHDTPILTATLNICSFLFMYTKSKFIELSEKSMLRPVLMYC